MWKMTIDLELFKKTRKEQCLNRSDRWMTVSDQVIIQTKYNGSSAWVQLNRLKHNIVSPLYQEQLQSRDTMALSFEFSVDLETTTKIDIFVILAIILEIIAISRHCNISCCSFDLELDKLTFALKMHGQIVFGKICLHFRHN